MDELPLFRISLGTGLIASSITDQYMNRYYTVESPTIITVVWMTRGFMASGSDWIPLIDLSVLIRGVQE